MNKKIVTLLTLFVLGGCSREPEGGPVVSREVRWYPKTACRVLPETRPPVPFVEASKKNKDPEPPRCTAEEARLFVKRGLTMKQVKVNAWGGSEMKMQWILQYEVPCQYASEVDDVEACRAAGAYSQMLQ